VVAGTVSALSTRLDQPVVDGAVGRDEAFIEEFAQLLETRLEASLDIWIEAETGSTALAERLEVFQRMELEQSPNEPGRKVLAGSHRVSEDLGIDVSLEERDGEFTVAGFHQRDVGPVVTQALRVGREIVGDLRIGRARIVGTVTDRESDREGDRSEENGTDERGGEDPIVLVAYRHHRPFDSYPKYPPSPD
jgi:hypothetical protein